ncbi:MAG: cyclic-di-AMP receptor [Clostridia bacterium]|nr:cyclic-di-AMP receptor [Clostridia bacterium]
MKLIIAIVNNEDSAVVSSALTREHFSVTKLSTTGGFLMVGNTTLLIGAEDKDVARVKDIINKFSQTRTHSPATTASFGRGFAEGAMETPVTVGGATVFVLSVDSMDKY